MFKKQVILEKSLASLLICILLIFQVFYVNVYSYASCVQYFVQKGVSADIIHQAIKAAEKAGFRDVELVLAIIYPESGFNPLAVGSAREKGLMQVTDDALREVARLCSEVKYDPGKLLEIDYNILVGCKYLEICSKRAKVYLPGVYSELGHLANTVMVYKDGLKWKRGTFLYAKKVMHIYRQIKLFSRVANDENFEKYCKS